MQEIPESTWWHIYLQPSKWKVCWLKLRLHQCGYMAFQLARSIPICLLNCLRLWAQLKSLLWDSTNIHRHKSSDQNCSKKSAWHVSSVSELRFTFGSPSSTLCATPSLSMLTGKTHPLKTTFTRRNSKTPNQCVLEAETRRSVLHGWERQRADHWAVTYQCLTKRHKWPPSF